MNSSIEHLIQQRKSRWREFLDLGSSRRCLFKIIAPSVIPSRPIPNPGREKDRIGWAWAQYQEQMGRLEWLDDDSLPFLDCYSGTELFAEAFGCKVHHAEDNNPFALPLFTDPTKVAGLKVPDLSCEPLARMFEIGDALKNRAGEAALFRPPDLQSPMDIAALIIEKGTFFEALLEEPEPILELASKTRELFVKFMDEWFKRYGTDFIAHFPDYYMPKGITLSEDEIGAVSEWMFVKYFLPELAGLSERYGGIGIHCCANSRHQWENMKMIPNLKMLNLVQPPEILKEAYACFEKCACQMHALPYEGPAWEQWKLLPTSAHIVLEVPADTKERAIETALRMRQTCV